MAKQERKWEKEDRKVEKRQLKHPEKEPRERKVREVILPCLGTIYFVFRCRTLLMPLYV